MKAADAALAGRLSVAIGALNRRIRPGGEGLSPGYVSALATVLAHDGLRANEIARIEKIAAPSATRLLADLESKGLVRREADPTDGRAVLIHATDAGRQAMEATRAARAEELLALLKDVDPQRLRIATEVLEGLLSPLA